MVDRCRHAGSPLILVVEDEGSLRGIMADALRQARYAVEEAADGVAALERLRRGGVACVVLDIFLPGITGLDILRQLEQWPAADRPAVVAVSGGGELPGAYAINLARLYVGGAVLYKPFRRHELVAAVRRVT